MNWIRAVFSRRRIYSEMAEDVRSHLEEKREELVARGMSREEAEFAGRWCVWRQSGRSSTSPVCVPVGSYWLG